MPTLFRQLTKPPFTVLMGCAILLLAIKGLQVKLDAQPIFFLGDSLSHLTAAVLNYIPAERSFTYGWIIQWTALASRNLYALIYWQVLAGGVTAWLLAFGLLRYFAVRPFVAITAGVLFAWDPMQLLHERMVLCETFSLLLLAINILLGLSYVRQPRVGPLPGVALTGILLVSLRFMFIPVVLAEAILLPVLAWRCPPGNPTRRARFITLGLHLVLALAASLALHAFYRHEVGRRTQRPPAYYHMNGLFLITAWAPVVEVEDAADPVMAEVLRQQAQDPVLPLRNPNRRENQLWEDGGLRARLLSALNDDLYAANESAKRTCNNTLRRDPWGLAVLTWETLGRYFMPESERGNRLLTEQGSDRAWPEELLTLLRDHYGFTPRTEATTRTPLKRYHLACYPWCVILLLSPLLWLLCYPCCTAPQRSGALLLFLLSGLIIGAVCVATTVSCLRYLHPLSFIALMALAVLANRLLDRMHPPRPSSDAAPGVGG